MQEFFYPNSVCIIGVSENPDNLARSIVQNLINWEYKGKIYLVGKKEGYAFNRKIYSHITDIKDEIDLAVILTPAETIPVIFDQCYVKGIKRVCVSSGGFEEFSEYGKQLAELILSKAKEYDIKFVGPNSVAVINTEINLCLPFPPVEKPEKVGNIAVLAQSGGVGLSILQWLEEEGLSYSKFVSLGNKLCLDEVDFLPYLLEDEKTNVILLYLESLNRGKEFLRITKAAKKPIILYKANKSEIAQKAALSHTAALTCDDKIITACCKQSNVIRVNNIHQLAKLAKFFNLPAPKSNRIVTISPAGGYTVIAADCAVDNGFVFPELSADMRKKIEGYARAGVIRISNPLDLGDTFSAEGAYEAIKLSFEQEDIDAVIALYLIRRMPKVVGSTSFSETEENILPKLDKLIKEYNKPFVLGLITEQDKFYLAKNKYSFPVLDNPEEVFELFKLFKEYHSNKTKGNTYKQFNIEKESVTKIFDRYQNKNKVDDIDAFNILESYGIRTIRPRLATTKQELENIISELNSPYVMKIHSPDILHKQDIGAVKLNLKNLNEAKLAYDEIINNVKAFDAKIDGVIIYEMVKPSTEIILGLKKDKAFGYVIIFGIGGIFTELIKDTAIRIAPVSLEDTEEMLNEIRTNKILTGYRGTPPINKELLKEYILRLSQLSSDFPIIKELDINPLIAQDNDIIACDVRMIIEP